jgi:hypothetical protein
MLIKPAAKGAANTTLNTLAPDTAVKGFVALQRIRSTRQQEPAMRMLDAGDGVTAGPQGGKKQRVSVANK